MGRKWGFAVSVGRGTCKGLWDEEVDVSWEVKNGPALWSVQDTPFHDLGLSLLTSDMGRLDRSLSLAPSLTLL